MCARLLKGAWPIQCTPSPPICDHEVVDRSIHTTMPWQPMPAVATEPSGTRVLVLCGQPGQNQGRRSVARLSPCAAARSPAVISSRRWSMRAATSAGTPSAFSRSAMALATSAGDRSALARSSQSSAGLRWLHSPP
ncbi:hypothetical protein D3C81_1232380 [compost metagenome]